MHYIEQGKSKANFVKAHNGLPESQIFKRLLRLPGCPTMPSPIVQIMSSQPIRCQCEKCGAFITSTKLASSPGYPYLPDPRHKWDKFRGRDITERDSFS